MIFVYHPRGDYPACKAIQLIEINIIYKIKIFSSECRACPCEGRGRAGRGLPRRDPAIFFHAKKPNFTPWVISINDIFSYAEAKITTIPIGGSYGLHRDHADQFLLKARQLFFRHRHGHCPVRGRYGSALVKRR